MRDVDRVARFPLAALQGTFDELARRRPAFHAQAERTTSTRVDKWQVIAQAGEAFDGARGRFVAPSSGHYLFMATSSGGAALWLCRNGEVVAEALDRQTPVLVAALRLTAGDSVTLHAAGEAGLIEWRGARG